MRKTTKRNYHKIVRPYILVLPSILLLLFFFLFPALQNITLSLKDISLFRLKQGGTFIGIGNYLEIIKDERIYLALFNTVFWLTILTVSLRIVFGICLALMANLKIVRRYHLSGLVRSCLLIPWVMPEVVAIASFQWLLHPRFGLINQLLLKFNIINESIPFFVDTRFVWFAVMAIIIWRELPFVSITILAGLQNIPEELYESAKVEGAGPWTIFWYITLPLLRPILTVCIMLMTIWTFNNFLYVWLSTRGGPGNYTQVLATELYNQAFVQYNLGYGAAIGIFMTLIMIVFSFLYYSSVFKRNMEGNQ